MMAKNLSTNILYHSFRHNLIKCISLELAAISLGNALNAQISEIVDEYREPKETVEETTSEKQFTKRQVRFLDLDSLSRDPIGEIRDFLNSNCMNYRDLLSFAETSPLYKESYRQLLMKVSNDPNRIIASLKGDVNSGLDTLYIGDSRTQGLLINETVTEEQTIYGVGYGYDYRKRKFFSKKNQCFRGCDFRYRI